ncbi:MAG: MATE family efflux transporter [Anaerovibrio slackiae]|uniref:MATE family efflux transporter n=2 Tax=Anaerovibrio slackiae TaxID=2652309 RepID=UPI0023F1A45C|nr:MATE family efflux transporter [Anaerovibrio slackiae]MDD6164174.1 MATE family efflux transporter [Anaerovibrio slackiae]
MSLKMSGHFTYKRLLRFVISPILMIICTAVYGVVDGFFISNYVGKVPFAAVNLVMPVDLVPVAIGFMIGEGGNALISKKLGENKRGIANQYFSLLIYTTAVIGVVLSLAGYAFTPVIADILGANDQLKPYCVEYGRILFAAQFFYVLQNIFQSFFIAAGKPDLSLKVSLLSGGINVLLDVLFIVVLQWGVAGAAWATALGQVAGGMAPLAYFARKNSSLLQITRTRLNLPVLFKTFTNGSSDMVSVLSASVITALYNYQLLSIAGEDGVAAYGAIMYITFIFMSIYLGYASGSAPLISFQYGAKNHEELHNLVRKSIVLMLGMGMVITMTAELAAEPLLGAFVGYDKELFSLTLHGYRMYVLAFLLMGLNIWGAALFTALNNGLVSAAISFLRTFGFEMAAVLLLPLWLGIDGIWISIFVAELCTCFFTVYFVMRKREVYHY